MAKTPFISVMVLSYNYGHLLKRALDAIACQSFRDFELIFINNGSTDNSQDVYEAFVAEHPELNTRCVQITENKGPANGWNHGLDQAQGEYVMFHDADDWMEKTCLEELAKAAEETGVGRISVQYREVDPNGVKGRVWRVYPSANDRMISPMLQGSILKKSVIDGANIRIPVQCLSYDLYLSCMIAAYATTKPIALKKTLYNYYINPTSVLSITNKIQKQDRYQRYKKFDKPQLDIVKECIQHTDDPLLRERMAYFVMVCIYVSILYYYAILPPNEADEFYDLLKHDMKDSLGNYSKNHYLLPINNGYDFIAGFAVWVMVMSEKIGHNKWFIKLLGKMYKRKLNELDR